jgi:hypothetical protein
MAAWVEGTRCGEEKEDKEGTGGTPVPLGDGRGVGRESVAVILGG